MLLLQAVHSVSMQALMAPAGDNLANLAHQARTLALLHSFLVLPVLPVGPSCQEQGRLRCQEHLARLPQVQCPGPVSLQDHQVDHQVSTTSRSCDSQDDIDWSKGMT